uniref:phosphatidylserine decarboxylase n=1 Tax=Meloidogyne floridensis TaxID=298350 RepID=A0A915NPF5_9BILA
MKKTTTTILSNLFYRQHSPPISLRFLTTKIPNKNSLIKLPTIKKVSGAVGALTLLYSLNILPEWRQFRDPKHYYSNLSVISGAVGALTLLYSLNILPEWRQFRDPKHYYSNLSIRIQCSPLVSFLSPKAGILCNLKVSTFLREYIYGLYVWLYNCNMEEAKEPSLLNYSTFSEFFNRELKEGIRPINLYSDLVSPADGTVLHFGKVIDGRIECVKGQENNSLYQLIIYLAPGDYHAFHSPTKWKIFEKTHFPGFYQSVRPTNLLKNPKLFCQNERIVLTGEWKFGYFSMTPVAAMFVGNIVIFDEQEKNRKLKENTKFAVKGLSVNPGEKIGEFRMGSAIVLIFEAPKNINFCIEAGQKLKYGQKLHFSVDQLQQTMFLNGHIYMTWSDDKATWDPSLFNNVRTTMVKTWEIWHPELRIANSVSGVNQYFEVESYPTFSVPRLYTTNVMSEVELAIYYNLEPSVMLGWGNQSIKKNIQEWELLSVNANLSFYKSHRKYSNERPNSAYEAQSTWTLIILNLKFRRNSPQYWLGIGLPCFVSLIIILLSFLSTKIELSIGLLLANFVLESVLLRDALQTLPPAAGENPKIGWIF